MIKPTIGRVVWYFPSGDNSEVVKYDDQPMAATVAYVHNDHMVNLSVVDHAGNQHACTSVRLVQEGEECPNGAYCEWMPYQKGQAAKTE